jgi:type IV pilus assembly protein PilB
MESLDLNLHQIPVEQIRELIEQYIPLQMCHFYGLIPLSRQDGESPSIVVGMIDPDNLEASDQLYRQLKPHGMEIRPVAIAPEDYQQLVQRYLDDNAQRRTQQQGLAAIDFADDLEAIGGFEELATDTEPDLSTSILDAETAPIIALVNKIFAKALQEGISDIHIEPQAEHLKIRFRKDGILNEAFPPLPHKISSAVISRIKIIANLNIAERRIPQNGHFRRLFEGCKFNFRVSILPSRFGEKIVIRLQECSAKAIALEQLVQNTETHSQIKSLLQHNRGLILVSSHDSPDGKNTLYAMLSECNAETESICLLEHMTEYDFPGVTQIQAIQVKGLDYASPLHALFSQDTDILFVDDIPDRATANILLDTARRSLVVGGLPIEHSEQAIDDLRLSGIENWRIARSLLGTVTQHLLRRLCPTCRVVHHPSPEELEQFGHTTVSLDDIVVHTAKQATPEERCTKTNFCADCGGTGYQGQIAVHEVMLVTEALQHLIAQGSSTETIRNTAIQAGMKTRLSQSLELFWQGATTLEEIERIFTKTIGGNR